jgi:adenine-specific DNA-methyltransferase
VYGRPNLYGFFIHKSLELLSQYGVLVFINPRTLLTDAYFSALRRYILKNASILLVLNIVNRRNVFDSVLQSTIVNIFSRNPKIKTVRIKMLVQKQKSISPMKLKLVGRIFYIQHKMTLYLL